LANEFFRHLGPDAAVTLSPRGQGILEVFVAGARIFDKVGEGGIYPEPAVADDQLGGSVP
jgi:predicted Rdx family selenoprotein